MEKQSQFVTGDARQHRNIPDGTFNYINNDRWCYNDNARQVGHRNIDRIKHIGGTSIPRHKQIRKRKGVYTAS